MHRNFLYQHSLRYAYTGMHRNFLYQHSLRYAYYPWPIVGLAMCDVSSSHRSFACNYCRATSLVYLVYILRWHVYLSGGLSTPSIVAHIPYQYPCAFQANCVVEDRIWVLWPRAKVWKTLVYFPSSTVRWQLHSFIKELLTKIFFNKLLLKVSMLLFRNVTT